VLDCIWKRINNNGEKAMVKAENLAQRDVAIKEGVVKKIREALATKAQEKLVGRDEDWTHYGHFTTFVQDLLEGVSVQMPPSCLFQRELDDVLDRNGFCVGTDEYLQVISSLENP
jgi:hypothetical protein